MADRWYLSVVDPTTQTSAGGSPCSSRYIVYDDVPGGVVNCQGSSAVPEPVMIAPSRGQFGLKSDRTPGVCTQRSSR